MACGGEVDTAQLKARLESRVAKEVFAERADRRAHGVELPWKQVRDSARAELRLGVEYSAQTIAKTLCEFRQPVAGRPRRLAGTRIVERIADTPRRLASDRAEAREPRGKSLQAMRPSRN